MQKPEEGTVAITHSGVLRGKDGKAFVCVRFERKKKAGGTDAAELKVPSGDLIRNEGFSADEVLQMKEYLLENEAEIREQAKSISSLIHILGS